MKVTFIVILIVIVIVKDLLFLSPPIFYFLWLKMSGLMRAIIKKRMIIARSVTIGTVTGFVTVTVKVFFFFFCVSISDLFF